ncbi:hypothetical protein G6M50_06385 [Agrobacterium rhizogenes]|nr:hypothetical protein [Rhizobium rhizogenes]NTJ77431.1 hypothetical protein [Rhizobium rhizogenes]
MTTTPHDKAVLAADEAYQNVQASEGIEHLTSEQQHMRGVAAAISAYLSAIGGIVCAREPAEHQRLVPGFGWQRVNDEDVPHYSAKGFPRRTLHIPIEAGNGGYGSRVRGWFVKDCADGWICFDNEEDAKLQVDATGAMMLVGFAPYDPIVKSAAEQFAKWLDDGPKLAKAAGCYVGIKVTNLPSPPSPSNEGEKQL